MKKAVFATLLTAGLLFASCGNQQPKEVAKGERDVPSETVVSEKQLLTVHVFRYDGAPLEKAQYLADVLKEVYPAVVLEEGTIALPQEHYYKPRNRYRGSGLLDDLTKRRSRGVVVLGVTNQVIFNPNEKSPTWGVMGISRTGQRVAVVSTIMASGKKQTDSDLRKLMMHELGHAFGLSHCKDEHCFMVDAKHKNKFPHTPSFCKDCQEFLNGKGWKL